MQSSDNAARKINSGEKQRSIRRVFGIDNAQTGEQKRDHDRRENFKKAFDPKMHDPPAPIFDDRDVRAHSPEKSGRVKERDTGA